MANSGLYGKFSSKPDDSRNFGRSENIVLMIIDINGLNRIYLRSVQILDYRVTITVLLQTSGIG